jgi:hypothetical protein
MTGLQMVGFILAGMRYISAATCRLATWALTIHSSRSRRFAARLNSGVRGHKQPFQRGPA